jgi:hypothetical protein
MQVFADTGPTFALIVLGAIVVAVLLRLLHGGMDHDRLQKYIENSGGKLISATWEPFGPGWAGSDKDRIYLVRYVDKDGLSRHAYCRTSGWSGVYFTQDTIDEPPGPPKNEVDSLKEENLRLRAELDQLKRRQG